MPKKSKKKKLLSQLLYQDNPDHDVITDMQVACLLQQSYDESTESPTITDIFGSSCSSSSIPFPGSPSVECDGDGLARRALRGRERWVFCASSDHFDTGKGVLSLKLDHEEVLTAWSDKGSLYIDGEGPQVVPELLESDVMEPNILVDVGNGGGWRVPEMCRRESSGYGCWDRKERVMRYREKRQSRLYSKRIRYEVRVTLHILISSPFSVYRSFILKKMDGDGAGFHRTEAISAVQDEEQFYGEDEDYEDLYNDVNVGESFYQQSQQRNDLQRNENPTIEEVVNVPPPSQPHQQPPPPVKPQILPDVKPHEPPLPPVQQQPPRPLQNQFQQGDTFPEGNSNNMNGTGGNFTGGGGGGGNFNAGTGGNFAVGSAAGTGGGGTTTLFVGDLHWWTTDADLESELAKYGPVKEVKFFDEKASGKSKGYAQVDFYDPACATACKENMNGHLFNGRPCVVAFSSPYSIRRMGEAQVSRNQQGTMQNQNMNQNMNGPNQAGMLNNKGRGNGPPVGGVNNNFGGRGGGNGGNWGRGGMGGRGGPMGNMRNNRMGPMGGGRGMMGNNGMVGPPPPMMHPGAILGQGFDYGAMGRMGGGFGGFPGPMGGGPFPGMMPPFRPVVAPHVNPAFFGRGMQGGPGMWQDPNMGGWGGEEQSSYGDDAGSEHQYGGGVGDGGGTHGKERERVNERGGSERRHEREKDFEGGQEMIERRHRGEDRGRERSRDYDRERERSRDRDRGERERYRDDRDRHGDHHSSRHREREREREVDRDDDWDRGRSKGRSRSREVENVKRRRGSE